MKLHIELDTVNDCLSLIDNVMQVLIGSPRNTTATVEPVESEPQGQKLAEDVVAAGNVADSAETQQETVADVQSQPVEDAALAADEIPQLAKGSKGQMIPYDERIHTGGANKVTQHGYWVKRRGVDDITIAKVEAELEGRTLEEPAEEQTAFELNADGQAVPAQQPQQPQAGVVTFPQLLQEYIAPRAAKDPNFHPVTLPAILAEYGVGALPQLAGMPDIVPLIAARLAELP